MTEKKGVDFSGASKGPGRDPEKGMNGGNVAMETGNASPDMKGQSGRLPKVVEADPRARHIHRILRTRTRPLWKGSKREVPTCPLSPELVKILRNAHRVGRLVRGLDDAGQRLANEDRGMGIADRHSGVPRGVRVSRLLLIADDGAERFYRQVEALLRRHGPRVLALRLDVDAEALGGLLFGTGHRARLLMLSRKEAVSAFLLALAGDSA